MDGYTLSLTFDETRYLWILIITINLIGIIYATNYSKIKKQSWTPMYIIVGLVLFDVVYAISMLTMIHDFNTDQKQFIMQSQTGLTFAFIFSWLAVILLISQGFMSQYTGFIWYSLLINHLSMILIVTSFVIDLTSLSKFPIPFVGDYSSLVIGIIITVIIELIRSRSKENKLVNQP